MKPFKARYTEFILLVARVVPCIFPQWLASIASYYTKENLLSRQQHEDTLQKVSLMEGNILWKSLSVMVKVDHNDLQSIQHWLSYKSGPGEFISNRDSDTFKNKYDKGTNFRNLGWIQFHQEPRASSLARINLKNNVCDSCYATIAIFPYGVNYLSLYFMLNKDVTNLISDVDISHIEKHYNFLSINPFNKDFKAITHHDKINQAEELINDNINTVCADVLHATQSILNLWGIRKSDKKFPLIADIYRNTNQNYFHRNENEQAKENDENHVTNHILIQKDMSFLNNKISLNESENFVMGHIVDKNELDAIFIKSKDYSEFTDFDNFARNGLSVPDSHLFISLFFDTSEQYNLISNKANKALLKNTNKLEENFDLLFESKNELELLTENLDAIKQDMNFYCREEYSQSATKILATQMERVNKLKSAIDRRLHSINTEIQAQNLRFNRKYSYLVGVSIVIQIILASMTIEWSKYDVNTLLSYLHYDKGSNKNK